MREKQEKEMLFISYTAVNAQGERIAPSKTKSCLMFEQARVEKDNAERAALTSVLK